MLPKRAIAAGAVVTLLVGPSPAAAQKEAFVDAFIAFHSALAGTYGDEGATAADAVERMSASLTEWERSQAATEAALKARAGITAGELALFYAENARYEDAIRSIDSAIAAEPQRASLLVFKGLLQEISAAGQPSTTFALASQRDGSDPVAAYLAASRLSTGSPPEGQQQRIETFLNAANGRPIPRMPFVRYELISDLSSRVPVFSPPAYEQGFVFWIKGRFNDAVAQFKVALAADPLVADPVARNAAARAGVAALRAKRGADAIQQLQAAAAAFPTSSEAQRLLGVTFRALARLPDSIRHLENAVRLAPADERSRVTLGSTLLEAGRLTDAERVLTQAVDALPRSGAVRWALADVYIQQGRGIDAISVLEEAAALPIVAGRAALYWRIAEIAHRYQEYEHVISALSRRAQVTINEGAAHKDLGLAYARMGRGDEALVELLMASLLGVVDGETLAAIGQAHLNAARYDAAEAALRRAVAIEPTNAQAHYALGMALTRMGRTADAKEQLDEFRRLRATALTEQQRQFEKKP